MITHQSVWTAIDKLAEREGLSCSALAKLAGLDPTSFNPSKRKSKDGRQRWPSTESISKILAATGENAESFWAQANQNEYTQMSHNVPTGCYSQLPLLGFAQAGAGGFFENGMPAGQGWDEVHFPSPTENGTYALEVSGDSMMPLYRDGDVIIVSPAEQIRRGDRVVARTLEGEVMAKILHRQTANRFELHSLNPEHEPRIFERHEIDWVARIMWASQ